MELVCTWKTLNIILLPEFNYHECDLHLYILSGFEQLVFFKIAQTAWLNRPIFHSIAVFVTGFSTYFAVMLPTKRL